MAFFSFCVFVCDNLLCHVLFSRFFLACSSYCVFFTLFVFFSCFFLKGSFCGVRCSFVVKVFFGGCGAVTCVLLAALNCLLFVHHVSSLMCWLCFAYCSILCLLIAAFNCDVSSLLLLEFVSLVLNLILVCVLLIVFSASFPSNAGLHRRIFNVTLTEASSLPRT